MQGIIVGIVLVGVVFLIAYFIKKKSETNAQQNDKTKNKGCSIAYYTFIGLLLIGLIVTYIIYKQQTP